MKVWAKVVFFVVLATGPSLADDIHESYVIRDGRSETVAEGYGGQMVHCWGSDERPTVGSDVKGLLWLQGHMKS